MSTHEHETQTSAAQPPVIDLDAEEVAGASETGSAEDMRRGTEEAEAAPRGSHFLRFMLMASTALVALVAGALLYRSLGEDLWPTSRMAAIEEQIASLDAATDTLSSQMTALGSTIDEIKSSNRQLTTDIDDATARASSADERLRAIDERLKGAETALAETRKQIAALGTEGGTGDTTAPPAPMPDLDGLTARVAALEAAVNELKAAQKSAPATNGDSALLSQALADLKTKLASGASYQSEFDMISRLVPQAPGLAVLGSHAATGLPDAQGLANAIEKIAAGLPKEEAPDVATADAGYVAELTEFLGTIVKVRTIGETDWREVGAGAAADAKAGNLAQALKRIDDSEGTPPPELAEWRRTAEARLEADAAIEQVSAAVLRALGGGTGKS